MRKPSTGVIRDAPSMKSEHRNRDGLVVLALCESRFFSVFFCLTMQLVYVRELYDGPLLFASACQVTALICRARFYDGVFEISHKARVGLMGSAASAWLLASVAPAILAGYWSLENSTSTPQLLLTAATWLAVLLASVTLTCMTRASSVGAVSIASKLALTWAFPWTHCWLQEMRAPSYLVISAAAVTPIGIALLFFSMYTSYVVESGLMKNSWSRPNSPVVDTPLSYVPFVSLHVPCYAEPPDLVIETLQSLAELDYDFHSLEIIVCDNNTADANLWLPVKHWCDSYNLLHHRITFRFFHIDNLKGAKAGALNFCLRNMSPKTELIALIDADYCSTPNFLRDLVPLMKDPNSSFVQTSHDYRNLDSVFAQAMYAEYEQYYKVNLPCASEFDGGFVVGTMAILRAAAVIEVGGWAEWCLTEDSEIAVRLHAAGYQGICLKHTYGRGVVPETFFDYRKQRFRWTAGPVQVLFHHWNLMMPWGGGKMTLLQRWIEFRHSTDAWQKTKKTRGCCAFNAVLRHRVLFWSGRSYNYDWAVAALDCAGNFDESVFDHAHLLDDHDHGLHADHDPASSSAHNLASASSGSDCDRWSGGVEVCDSSQLRRWRLGLLPAI